MKESTGIESLFSGGKQLLSRAIHKDLRIKSLFSRGKQLFSRAIHEALRISGFHNKEFKDDVQMQIDDGNGAIFSDVKMRQIQPVKEPLPLIELPEISEPSDLLSDKVRNTLYASLPALICGRKWLLLYSTRKHGISLSTMYQRNLLWPGLGLLVVGDCKGAVFGGLIEAPLRPSNKRKYQGTNDTFVFTNIPGHPFIYRPTVNDNIGGANRYFTLCTRDFLAIGGGSKFVLYLDGDFCGAL